MSQLYWNEASGRERGGTPCRTGVKIIDANGLEWNYVTWCDTETGEIEYAETDADGQPKVDWSGLVKRFEKTAAPLRIVE